MKLRILIGTLLLVVVSTGIAAEAKAQRYYYGPRRGGFYYSRSYRPVYTLPPYGPGYGYYYRPRPVYRPYGYYGGGYYRGYYPAYRAHYHRHFHW